MVPLPLRGYLRYRGLRLSIYFLHIFIIALIEMFVNMIL